jgi:hypothetical protein
MPNHIRVAVTFVGRPDHIDRLMADAAAQRPGDDEPQYFSFHAMRPIPELLLTRSFGAEHEAEQAARDGAALECADGCVSEYDWCTKYWGTKWGGYNQGEPPQRVTLMPNIDAVTYTFTCAWSPPIALLQYINAEWRLPIIMSYGGEGPTVGRSAWLWRWQTYQQVGSVVPYPEWDDNDDDASAEAYDAYERQYLDTHDVWMRAIVAQWGERIMQDGDADA